MTLTETSILPEATSYDAGNRIKRSRIVLTATIGGVCIIAVTAAFITLRVSRWLRGRKDRKRRRRMLNATGGNRQKRNAWDVQEWEGTPA